MGSWKVASRAKRVEGVDLRVLAKREHQGSLKAEVINTCFLKGLFVPNAPSIQDNQLRVEPMWFYQKVQPTPRPGNHWGELRNEGRLLNQRLC